jgi:hypothetical protein
VIRGGVGCGDGGDEVESKLFGGIRGWAVRSDLGVDHQRLRKLNSDIFYDVQF